MAVIVVAVIVMAGYAIYEKDSVDVVVQGFGSVRGEISIHYADGSVQTVTKVKTGSVITSYQYEGKTVRRLSFDLSVEPKTAHGKNVRILCDPADSEHMSKVVVVAVDAAGSEVIATYPLSLYSQAAYQEVPTGEYTLLFNDISTTPAELSNTSWQIGEYRVRWEAHLWMNYKRSSDEAEGVQVSFILPINVLSITNEVPDPDDGGGGSGGGGDGRLDPTNPFPPWGGYKVLTVETEVRTKGTATVERPAWQLTG